MEYHQELLSLLFLYLSPGPIYYLLLGSGEGVGGDGRMYNLCLAGVSFQVLLEEMELRRGTMPRNNQKSLHVLRAFSVARTVINIAMQFAFNLFLKAFKG